MSQEHYKTSLKPNFASPKELDQYIAAASSAERLLILESWKKSGKHLPDSMIRGFLEFPLSLVEKIALFEVCATEHPASLELWILDEFLKWDQNLAAVAIRTWARSTHKILWHRLIPMTMAPGFPQRVRFSILDIGAETHGYELTKASLESPSWEELSPAFHALLFERSICYCLFSDRLTKLAWSSVKSQESAHHPELRSIIPAVLWLIKYDHKELKKYLDQSAPHFWVTTSKILLEHHEDRESLIKKIEKQLTKGSSSLKHDISSIPVWSRDLITSELMVQLANTSTVGPGDLDGVSRSVLESAVPALMRHSHLIRPLLTHLPFEKASLLPTGTGSHFLASYHTEQFPELSSARIHANKQSLSSNNITSVSQFFQTNGEPQQACTHPIHGFAKALTGAEVGVINDDMWATLSKGLLDPQTIDVGKLSALTRKHQGLASLAHILVLGKLKGRDDAVLKILDHIRSEDETELRTVARSLGEIDTQRSLLELISMITRRNATIGTQQEIVSILKNKDLKTLQRELRSTVQDLILPENTDHPLFQIKDDLSAMLGPLDQNGITPPVVDSSFTRTLSELDLDNELAKMIGHYRELSSEVKRALRTALFFNKKINDSPEAKEIDLSPLIDMQYKAMELLYREFFEDLVSQSLQKGSIQRKLDVIGYARPVVRQMDEFEVYIASQPVVRDIPFFSKFKLRKMLRAICQFEPGKRFTLDGLKAFGLYFFVFGRQNCKMGLKDLFHVGTETDLELAELCKELHVFQDFRNRAAHEGFHPEASNDIPGIWRTTATLVQWAFRIKNSQKTN